MRSLPRLYLARAGEKYAKNLMGCVEGAQSFEKNPQPAACTAARSANGASYINFWPKK